MRSNLLRQTAPARPKASVNFVENLIGNPQLSQEKRTKTSVPLISGLVRFSANEWDPACRGNYRMQCT
jgi:hypothetical protein